MFPLVARTLCWGTYEEAERLGVDGQGTRKWAYRWIEEHVRCLVGVRTIIDLGGGGVQSELCNRLSPYVEEVVVVDKAAGRRSSGNIKQIVLDMEEGLEEIADESVDILVSASAIEHLTKRGQITAFAEIERILVPGGIFCGTVSYITGLTPGVIALLQDDPAFAATGSAVYAPFDAKKCLDSAPLLAPMYPPCCWKFPGFECFDENELLSNDAFISDTVRSYGQVQIKPEIESLQLKWFEMGLFLVKEGFASSTRATVSGLRPHRFRCSRVGEPPKAQLLTPGRRIRAAISILKSGRAPCA